MTGELWNALLEQLQRRGAGRRESGAFLLTRRSTPDQPATNAVIAMAYYDDLDAHCLTGGITMSGTAYDALWSRCRDDGLRVVADVHTHPGSWVLQSAIDRANPMMAHAGHIAMIVGNYADSSGGDPPIGMYRYLGAGTWQVLETHRQLHLQSRPDPHLGWMRRWKATWTAWWKCWKR